MSNEVQWFKRYPNGGTVNASLRVRIAQAMAAHPRLGGLYSDHQDSYLNPPPGATDDYVTEADAVLAVAEAEIDRVARDRDSEIEQLTAEVERLRRCENELARWRDGRRRRSWPLVTQVPDGLWYAAELVRAQGTEGGEEHDRLLREACQRMVALHEAAKVLLADRDRLSSLLRGMARRAGELRQSLKFADAHVPQWERIIAEHKAEIERLTAATALADDLLAMFATGEKGHPGRPCVRSRWIDEAAIERLRERRAALDATPSTHEGNPDV